jgi:hypothetical protein
VFDSVPSELDQIYWRFTLNDIKVKLRLHLGHQQALIVQEFQTIALIVGQAFGSKKNKAKVSEPSSAEELQAAFGSVFG